MEDICVALGLRPSAKQITALLAYLDLLERWNATYNLSAVRDRSAMLTQHLSDCLAVVPALQRHASSGRLLDVGSGGGLPGVVIAVLMPDYQVTCIDAVGKKMAFVRQVAGLLPLPNLKAEHRRVEDLLAPPYDVITSRAFASLVDLVSLTRKHLAPAGVWMAMKGRVPHDEIAALPPTIDMFHVEQVKVPGLDAQRSLVWMRARPGADLI